MMQKQLKEELKSLDVQQLKDKIEYFRKEYFTTKLNAENGRVKDVSQFKRLRKNIAQALTFLHEKTKHMENKV